MNDLRRWGTQGNAKLVLAFMPLPFHRQVFELYLLRKVKANSNPFSWLNYLANALQINIRIDSILKKFVLVILGWWAPPYKHWRLSKAHWSPTSVKSTKQL